MQSKLTLDLNALAMESFEAVQAATETTENVATCLFTNCGKQLCCA